MSMCIAMLLLCPAVCRPIEGGTVSLEAVNYAKAIQRQMACAGYLRICANYVLHTRLWKCSSIAYAFYHNNSQREMTSRAWVLQTRSIQNWNTFTTQRYDSSLPPSPPSQFFLWQRSPWIICRDCHLVFFFVFMISESRQHGWCFHGQYWSVLDTILLHRWTVRSVGEEKLQRDTAETHQV